MISGISTPSGLMINGESSSNGLTVSHMRCGSWIITDEEIVMAENEFAPVTPGEMHGIAASLPIFARRRCQNINQPHVKDWVRIFSRPSSLVLAGT